MESMHVHLCGLVGGCSSEMCNIGQRHFCFHSEMSGTVNQNASATSNTSLLTEYYPRATCASYWWHGFCLELTMWFRIKYLPKDFCQRIKLCTSKYVRNNMLNWLRTALNVINGICDILKICAFNYLKFNCYWVEIQLDWYLKIDIIHIFSCFIPFVVINENTKREKDSKNLDCISWRTEAIVSP